MGGSLGAVHKQPEAQKTEQDAEAGSRPGGNNQNAKHTRLNHPAAIPERHDANRGQNGAPSTAHSIVRRSITEELRHHAGPGRDREHPFCPILRQQPAGRIQPGPANTTGVLQHLPVKRRKDGNKPGRPHKKSNFARIYQRKRYYLYPRLPQNDGISAEPQ